MIARSSFSWSQTKRIGLLSGVSALQQENPVVGAGTIVARRVECHGTALGEWRVLRFCRDVFDGFHH